MPTYSRGGIVAKTLKLGRVMCLRQDMMHPGERIDLQINGGFRLGALREQEAFPIHIDIAAYLTPCRWLDSNFDTFFKSVTDQFDFSSALQYVSLNGRSDYLGIGTPIRHPWQIWTGFKKNYERVYNEYYKMPMRADTVLNADDDTDNTKYGLRSANLPHFWTRFIDQSEISDADKQVSITNSKLDIVKLAEQSATYKMNLQNEYFAQGRYREIIDALWGAAGTNEVDKVPFLVGSTSSHIGARNLWATNADGLGSIAGIYEFSLNHDFGILSAPEHCIYSVFALLRAVPIHEHETNPLAWGPANTALENEEFLGIPGIIANRAPKQVNGNTFHLSPQTGGNMYQAYGDCWRKEWHCVDSDIANRDSFLINRGNMGTDSAQEHRDMDHAFRSTSLGHAFFKGMLTATSYSQIPAPMHGIQTGANI